jgi:hypothetical protein
MSKIKEGRTLPNILKVLKQRPALVAPVGKVRPVLTVVADQSDGRDEPTTAASIQGSIAASASLIDEIVREGARRMLAEALQAEVAAYIGRLADELDERGRRLVVRNGSRRGARGLLGSGLDSRRGLPETRHVRNLPTS